MISLNGLPLTFAFDRKRDQAATPAAAAAAADSTSESNDKPNPPPATEMSPSSARNSRSKRNSGFFDVGYSQMQASRDQEQAQRASVQRRTSKRASSQDRHGQVYGDDVPGFSAPPDTPDTGIDPATMGSVSPSRDGDLNLSPRRRRGGDSALSDLPAHLHPTPTSSSSSASPYQSLREESNTSPRPGDGARSRLRTRTLDERIRSRSPQTKVVDSRKRIGSFQSASQIQLPEDEEEGQEDGGNGSGTGAGLGVRGSSDGGHVSYPAGLAVSSSNMSSGRSRLQQAPPARPISPATMMTASPGHSANASFSTPAGSEPSPSSAVTTMATTATANAASETDGQRILGRARVLKGVMRGKILFRRAEESVWQSGYCGINKAAGSLKYQTQGEIAQTKTLIPDLRGCEVRTHLGGDMQPNFLEIITSVTGYSIHLRPELPETFDSWLAALLWWQSFEPSGGLRSANALPREFRAAAATASVPESSVSDPSSTKDRASNRASIRKRPDLNTHANMRDSPVLKYTRVLWWDRTTPQSTPIAPPRRVSTYKQQRMAAGPPWRKAIASVRENGLFEVLLESPKDKNGDDQEHTIAASVDMGNLHRYAIQRLHSSVLDDEFSLGVFTQYSARQEFDSDLEDGDANQFPSPVFLSFESRIYLEAWYAMFRAFTIPELYGPGVATPDRVVHPMATEGSRKASLPANTFRVKRSLFLRITEAHLHSARSAHQDPSMPLPQARDDAVDGAFHAEIHIDGHVRGRTSIQPPSSNPFWRSDYEFNHLPPLAGTATIYVKSRQAGQRDWTLVSGSRLSSEESLEIDHLDMVEDIQIAPLDTLHGSVELELDEMDRGVETEQWWTLLNSFGDPTGRILLRIRVDETIILMSDEYNELGQLLHAFSNAVATDIVDKCSDTASYVPETLLNIFQVSNSAGKWITSMIEDDIDNLQREASVSRFRFSRRIASNDSYDSGVEREILLRDFNKNANASANLLFRGNTPLTKALEMHMRRLAKEYLEAVLGERLRDIDESEPECEVDPNKVHDPQALERNWRNLKALTESFWRSISLSANACPPELRQIFRHIRACTEERYGDFLRTIAYSSVSAFLFLRLLVPAILSPSLFGLLKEVPRPRSRRTLTLIAKSIQSLANMTSFGTKEPWMENMNDFLNSHRQGFKNFIDDICGISQERASQPPTMPREFAAPNRLGSNLPPTSKEGFPSLPYLIDQPREYAILVNAWVDSRAVSGGEPVPAEDLARLDVVCSKLKERTRDVLKQAVEKASADRSAHSFERLLRQLDARGKATSKGNSRMTSPMASPRPSQQIQESERPLTQSPRPQPIRTSSSQTAPIHRSSVGAESQPASAASLEQFVAVAAAARAMLSPTGKTFAESRNQIETEGNEDAEGVSTPPDSTGNRTRPGTRDRLASIVSGGTVEMIHPLSADHGSAASGRSKASSLQGVDSDHPLLGAIVDNYQGLPLSALPSASSSGLGLDMTERSPLVSPRDPEPRLFDKLTFRKFTRNLNLKDKAGQERREEDEGVKKAKKKDEKEKKKEDKKKDKGKDKGKDDMVGEGQEGPASSESRLGFGIIS